MCAHSCPIDARQVRAFVDETDVNLRTAPSQFIRQRRKLLFRTATRERRNHVQDPHTHL